MFPFGRTYRLYGRGGAGICCDADGVSLGPTVLVERVQKNYFLRPAGDIIDALEAAYGLVGQGAADNLAQKIAGIARSLNDGNMPHAMLKTLYLRLSEIPAENLAKMNRVVMGKANPGRRVDRAAAEIAAGDLAAGLSQALQMSLPKAKVKLAASDMEKFNPWHDLLGMFTDAAHAVAGSVVGSANAAEAPVKLPEKTPKRDPTVGPHDLPLAHTEKLVAENNKSGLPDSVVVAVAYKESRFDPTVINRTRTGAATGLMQVRGPAFKDFNATRKREGKRPYTDKELADPAINVEVGSWYLRSCITKARRIFGEGRYPDFYVKEGLKYYGPRDDPDYADSIMRASKKYDKVKDDEEKMAVLRTLHN